jgi:lysophospholipase L1-like esterase
LIRRLLIWAALFLVLFAAVLGGEILLALRREYLPTDAPLELDGAFGPREGTPLRFVVLGDSTAAGLGAGDASEAYPTLLAQRLAEETGRRVQLTALGISGARVTDVLNEQVPRAKEIDPDLIFVGIGANDVTHLTPLEDVEKWMRRVISELKSTGAPLVVAGAPDMRVLAWLEPLRTITYLRGRQVTDAIEDVAREEGAAVVELAKETGHHFAAEPDLHFSEDEFHPSARGYERWADAIFPVLIETFER